MLSIRIKVERVVLNTLARWMWLPVTPSSANPLPIGFGEADPPIAVKREMKDKSHEK